MTLLGAALAAHDAGFCVLPAAADGSKRPAIDWKPYIRGALPSLDDLTAWFHQPSYDGLGYVCGAVSGNLEMLEIEGRARHLEDEIKAAARATGLGDILDRIVAGYSELSPSGGIHYLYRCTEPVEGNLKLARRPGEGSTVDVLIETRGEGGWTVAAPSGGATHPSGRPWTIRRGGPATVATITPAERKALLDLCRTFDRMPERAPMPARATLERLYSHEAARAGMRLDDERPGDRYMRETSWEDILEPHGWTVAYVSGDVTYWRRPGKTDPGTSATTNALGTDRLKVFSTSTPFDTETTYDKLGALAVLNHGGDFTAAVRSLRPERHPNPPQRPTGPETDAETADAGTERQVILTPASSITPRRVRWLWEGRIPGGMLTLLGGREGIGKSTFAYDLVSDVTRGKVPGEWRTREQVDSGQIGVPKDVIVAATEDSWEHTIIPRLMAARADLDRVHRVEVREHNALATLTLPSDIPQLTEKAEMLDVALLLLDPLMSRLDRRLDSHKDAEVRLALDPLVQFAEETGVAIVGILHVNKSQGTDPLRALMGSVAFAAVARAVLMVVRDPDDAEIRHLGLAKNNLGRIDFETLPYRIIDVVAHVNDDGEIHAGRLSWAKDKMPTGVTLEDMHESSTDSADERTAVGGASAWLADWLGMHGGAEWSETIKKEGAKEGHKEKTLQRAAKRIGVMIENVGMPRKTYWRLATATIVHAVTDSRDISQDNLSGDFKPVSIDVTSQDKDVSRLVGTVETTGQPPARGVSTDDDLGPALFDMLN